MRKVEDNDRKDVEKQNARTKTWIEPSRTEISRKKVSLVMGAKGPENHEQRIHHVVPDDQDETISYIIWYQSVSVTDTSEEQVLLFFLVAWEKNVNRIQGCGTGKN